MDVGSLEEWKDIRNRPKAIKTCMVRWQSIANSIGCTLLGFNDGKNATFISPDGDAFQVREKFRAAISEVATQAEADNARIAELEAMLDEVADTLEAVIINSGDFIGGPEDEPFTDPIRRARTLLERKEP